MDRTSDPSPRPAASPDHRHLELSVAAVRRARGETGPGACEGESIAAGQLCLPASLAWNPCDAEPALAARADRLQARAFLRMVSASERFVVDALLRTAACRRAEDPLLEEALLRVAEDKLAQARHCARLDGRLAAELGTDPRGPCRLPLPQGPGRRWATWAIAGWIALAAQAHHRAALREERLAGTWREGFATRWQQVSRHVVITDSLWSAEDAKLDAAGRAMALEAFVVTVTRIDRLLRREAADGARRWPMEGAPARAAHRDTAAALLAAARRQHLAAGWLEPRFQAALARFLAPADLQCARERLATVTGFTA